ncbi:unnamed protein product [Sphagnum jensenii]|uniref:Uncharacterized protein n=1 Tax=Sphagnum jensenii TaxID=128206 RepID=A0ABP0VAT3_9BRYO
MPFSGLHVPRFWKPQTEVLKSGSQLIPGDIGCLDIDVPCSKDSSQPICVYRDQISVYKMDAGSATGPVTARHIGDRMYRGQYFVMQMDAHCLFGEEIAIGIRGFTFGYDFYAPKESVVFHEYAGVKSLKRATAVIGMAPDISPDSYDHTDLDMYGIGRGYRSDAISAS